MLYGRCMAQTELQQLEAQLGDPAAFIITPENRHHVLRWAHLAGYDESKWLGVKNAALANLYCSHQRGPTEVQEATAEAIARVLETLPQGGINADTVRQIVREELDERPTQRLTVTSPRGVVTLDGLQHYITKTVIKVVGLAHPVMMVGPAGCGKTTIAEHTAKALQLPFYITSTITDTHELTGFVDGHGNYHDTPFRNAFEKGGVWVADEIDAWDAAALLTANSALANGYVTFPDNPTPVNRHADFRMIATANTFGNGADRVYIGRNELDAASLDRFCVINVDYDIELERRFANGNEAWLDYVWSIRRAVTSKRIRHVVSSRAIIMGAAALNAGLDRKSVEAMYLYKGISATDREKLES